MRVVDGKNNPAPKPQGDLLLRLQLDDCALPTISPNAATGAPARARDDADRPLYPVTARLSERQSANPHARGRAHQRAFVQPARLELALGTAKPELRVSQRSGDGPVGALRDALHAAAGEGGPQRLCRLPVQRQPGHQRVEQPAVGHHASLRRIQGSPDGSQDAAQQPEGKRASRRRSRLSQARSAADSRRRCRLSVAGRVRSEAVGDICPGLQLTGSGYQAEPGAVRHHEDPGSERTDLFRAEPGRRGRPAAESAGCPRTAGSSSGRRRVRGDHPQERVSKGLVSVPGAGPGRRCRQTSGPISPTSRCRRRLRSACNRRG